MPYNTNGIFLIDFIKGIQKKYNLIIYPSNTVANQMIVETFDTWYKKGIRQDFNKFIDTGQKIEVSPLSLYKQITFKDTDDNDYASQQYNRVYNKGFGENQFYYSSSFFAGGDWNVETVFAGAPLIKIPNTYTSGSFLTNDCTTYTLINETEEDKIIRYTPCGYTGSVTPPYSDFATINVPAYEGTVEVCSTGLFDLEGGVSILYVGDACSSGPIGSGSYYDVWVPGYIADAEYKPTTVSPRLLYYNGLVPCTTFYINGFINSSSIQNKANYAYPYFDYYLASSGSLPDVNSTSSLFNNELSAYDVIPNNNLVTDYWATYIALLYNPRSKMLKANGVIPFANYINIELNDVAQFRGNYYHVRAINNYNLSTGECEIELLGPIIPDTLSSFGFTTGSAPTPTPSPTPTPTPSPTGPTPTPTPTPTPSPTGPTPTPTPTPTVSPTPSPTPTTYTLLQRCEGGRTGFYWNGGGTLGGADSVYSSGGYCYFVIGSTTDLTGLFPITGTLNDCPNPCF
jgi:hypothetical protein